MYIWIIFTISHNLRASALHVKVADIVDQPCIRIALFLVSGHDPDTPYCRRFFLRWTPFRHQGNVTALFMVYLLRFKGVPISWAMKINLDIDNNCLLTLLNRYTPRQVAKYSCYIDNELFLVYLLEVWKIIIISAHHCEKESVINSCIGYASSRSIGKHQINRKNIKMSLLRCFFLWYTDNNKISIMKYNNRTI